MIARQLSDRDNSSGRHQMRVAGIVQAHITGGELRQQDVRALLVADSVASLAANVAVAEPTAAGRVIAAWPSFEARYRAMEQVIDRLASELNQDQRVSQQRWNCVLR